MDRTTLILRLALLVSVALAISGARLPVGRASTPALEVRDISASMGRGATRSGTTGGGAWLAVADGVRQVPAGAGVEGLSRAASTLGAGLAEAARSWPGRDVVLTSDGRATDDALAGVEAVAAAGGRVFTRPPETPSADVALLSARLVRGGAGTPVRVIARVASSTQGRGRLVLSRQGRTVGSTEIVFAADTSQTLVLEDPDVPSEAVGYLLRLALAPGTPDDDPGNDELALGLAPERPSVRVWGELDLEALRGSEPGLEVTRLPAAGAADLGAADLVVVAGLPWSSIGPEGAEALARFVAEGGRLLLLG